LFCNENIFALPVLKNKPHFSPRNLAVCKAKLKWCSESYCWYVKRIILIFCHKACPGQTQQVNKFFSKKYLELNIHYN